MTSIGRTPKALREFFVHQLMPLADRMKGEGTRFLATGQEHKAASYYVSREKRTMERADFQWGGCSSVDEFSEELANLWRGQGLEALAAFAPALSMFATPPQANDAENQEVSSFIYVMY